MCQTSKNQQYAESCVCGCGCASCSFTRRYFSAKEELDCLKYYREQLKKELEAVEERIKELEHK